MVLNPNRPRHQTTLNFKYPPKRDSAWKSTHDWLDSKRETDGAEGLWRVHDDLYDVTDFVNIHPGGKMWLELTKGTDITEAFESHHLSKRPEEMLKKHFIRKATTPRNSPFVFTEDGFFRTLKRNIGPILKDIPKENIKASNYMMDLLLALTVMCTVLANLFWSYTLGIISGILLAHVTIASHNYFHRRDNFRMYYFNLSMLQFRDWRISHALSHHLYPNTIMDLEISFMEPLIEYFPKKKSFTVKYVSWIYVFLFWLTFFYINYVNRFVLYYFIGENKHLHWSDVIPLVLPLIMNIFCQHSILFTIPMWLFIIGVSSLWFGIVAFNGGHHAPEVFHDGDAPRSRDGIDWGIHQLDTVMERSFVIGNPFLVLTNFGDHALHHLFPTLDHGALRFLYPIFNDTMEKFNLKLRVRSQLDLIKGQFLQISNELPNSNPPQ